MHRSECFRIDGYVPTPKFGEKKSATINQDIHGSGDRHPFQVGKYPPRPSGVTVSNRKPQKGLGFGGWNLGPKFSDLWRIQATFSKYHSLLKFHWESRIISLKKKMSFSAKEFKSSNHVPPGFSIFKSPRIRKIPKADFFGDFGGDSLTFHHHFLGGGWTNPSEKYSSNCILSPRIGMKIKIFKTTT